MPRPENSGLINMHVKIKTGEQPYRDPAFGK